MHIRRKWVIGLLVLLDFGLSLCPENALSDESAWERTRKFEKALQDQGGAARVVEVMSGSITMLGWHPTRAADMLRAIAEKCELPQCYADAELIYKGALAILDKDPGSKDSPVDINILYNLGNMFLKQGRYTEAEKVLKKALLKFEMKIGIDDPRAISILNALSITYLDQDRYSEAEMLLDRMEAIDKEDSGSIITLAGRGTTCHKQGHYIEAESFLKRALAISEEKNGPEDPITLKVLNNLASVYSAQGQCRLL